MAQFAAVATVVFAILGFEVVALVGLGVTFGLLMLGFAGGLTAPSYSAPEDEEPADPPAPPAPTPNEEALKRDG